jgi:tetratricopeptide (TPR) repeat protein
MSAGEKRRSGIRKIGGSGEVQWKLRNNEWQHPDVKGDAHLRRLIPTCSILAIALFLATIASAQTTSVSGQIIAPDGTPWVDLDVIIQNTNTGQHFAVKTDKDGRYAQWGLPPGVYKIEFYDQRSKWFTYSEIRTLLGTQENDVSTNFSKSSESAHREAQKQTEEDDNKFNNVKAHVSAGVGAMLDSDTLRTQLATTPAAQKGPLQDNLASDYQTAIGEFQLAERADSPTDVKIHAMIWAHLGEAYERAGQYDDATNAYQKAVALRPEALYYQNLSKAQASFALAQTDPKDREEKLADADATCEQAAALDPTAAARCWKNIGILLSNKADIKGAITAWKKTTQLDPKDAQAWFLFGTALLATVETKQEGNMKASVFLPGTAEAFQTCIDANPNGPYASQAKEVLDALASMSAGEKTTVRDKKNRK